MATYVAFLRAVNVGGRFVKMDNLRRGLSDKGFGDVESYIQSGNVRFTTRLRAAERVGLVLESALEELCGFTVKAILRTPEQLRSLTAYGMGLATPLTVSPAEPAEEVRRYVTFLKDDPDDAFLERINGWDVVGERAHVHDREVYLWLAHPSHQAKLTNAQIERSAVVATSRDWKVVSALGEKWGS